MAAMMKSTPQSRVKLGPQKEAFPDCSTSLSPKAEQEQSADEDVDAVHPTLVTQAELTHGMPPCTVARARGALNEKYNDEEERPYHAACKQQPGNESLVHLFLLWLSFGSPRLLPSVRQGVASLQRNLTGFQWYAGALGAGHPSCGRVLVLERVGRATSPRLVRRYTPGKQVDSLACVA